MDMEIGNIFPLSLSRDLCLYNRNDLITCMLG